VEVVEASTGCVHVVQKVMDLPRPQQKKARQPRKV